MSSAASVSSSPVSTFADLSWAQRDFGEHLEMLAGIADRKIDFRVRCNPVKAARLTDAHLHEIRQTGITVTMCARQTFDEGAIDFGALPERICIAFPGRTPEGLRDLVFMVQTRALPDAVKGLDALLGAGAPIYRLHYLMSKDKGQIMGFTAYFGFDASGETIFGSLGKFRFEDHPNGQEAKRAVLRALRAHQHMKAVPILKAEGMKPVLSIEATHEILTEVGVLGNALKQVMVSLKKEDLKHPLSWMAGKVKGFLEDSIEKHECSARVAPVVSAKVGAVTFSSK